MSIGINTNYGTNKYAGINGNQEPAWTKNDDKGKEKAASVAQSGVIYDKQDVSAQAANSEKVDEKAIYKKSKEDRAAIVQQLKAAEEQQRNNLISSVQKTLQGQVELMEQLRKMTSGGSLQVGNLQLMLRPRLRRKRTSQKMATMA